MGLLSTTLNTAGLVFLAHAVYSSYEHSLTSTTPSSDPATSSSTITTTTHPLPTDIVLELLLSVLVLCTGIVLHSSPLRPIQWNIWASQVEMDERREPQNRVFGEEGQMVVNPYRWLEERRGFVDIRGERRAFADWIREGAGVEK